MPTPSEYPQARDPHYLRQVKDALLTLWRELPPEHQAIMLFMLLRQGLDGEMGDWISGALVLTLLKDIEPPRPPLLDEASCQRLPKLRETEQQGVNALAQVKFFIPGGWTWYASEFDGEDIFFGLVIGFETEFGSFSLSELSNTRGRNGAQVERDTTYTPTTFAQLLEQHKGEHPDF